MVGSGEGMRRGNSVRKHLKKNCSVMFLRDFHPIRVYISHLGFVGQ